MIQMYQNDTSTICQKQVHYQSYPLSCYVAMVTDGNKTQYPNYVAHMTLRFSTRASIVTALVENNCTPTHKTLGFCLDQSAVRTQWKYARKYP